MAEFPLAHISWSVPDNATRKACDAFLRDVFDAETAFEVLMNAQAEAMGLDREETLLVVGDTMLISLAPMGPGLKPESAIGSMLRRCARLGMWIGIAIQAADLDAARDWVRARGFEPFSWPGMEERYFLLDRDATLGMRIEFLKGNLMNDPRVKPGWRAERWRDEHPLGIEGLQSIGLSTPSLDEARAIFARRLSWDEIATRELPDPGARCASFLIGDTVLEAMEPTDADSPLARHSRDVKGIYCLTFQVRSARAAADYLRGKGLDLIGDPERRFAIRPEQAFDRILYFTDEAAPGGAPLRPLLGQPGPLP